MWKRRVQNGSWTINHNSVLLPVSPFSFFDLFFFFSFWSFSPKQESSPFFRALSLHTYSSKETWNLIQGEDVFDKRVDSTSSCFSKYQSSMSSSCFSNRLSHWVFSWVTCAYILFSHCNHIFQPLSHFPNNRFFISFFIFTSALGLSQSSWGMPISTWNTQVINNLQAKAAWLDSSPIWCCSYLDTLGHQTFQGAEGLALTFCKSCWIFPLLFLRRIKKGFLYWRKNGRRKCLGWNIKAPKKIVHL